MKSLFETIRKDRSNEDGKYDDVIKSEFEVLIEK